MSSMSRRNTLDGLGAGGSSAAPALAEGLLAAEDDTNTLVPPGGPSSARLPMRREASASISPIHYPWEHLNNERESKSNLLFGAYRRKRSSLSNKRSSYTFLDWLQLVLPCVSWLRTYNVRECLLADVIAGVSVGFMVVPQAMSYANLAGLPSVYGLYGAFLPVMAYALVGSSRHLAVGPVAVTSLLISANLHDIVDGADDISNPNSPTAEQQPIQDRYNRMAIQLSFLVACLYTGVGMLRLGFMTSLLSHSVISGFTSGAAITIGLSQLKYILGISIPRKDRLHDQVKNYIDHMENFKWQEFLMGMTLLVMMVTMKEIGKSSVRLRWLRPLGPISACVISLLAVYIGHVDKKGIKIIGSIPKGLPKPTVGWWVPMDDFSQLIPVAIVVMLVDLLESTSIARALAVKHKYELQANREIVGLGLANFAGSAFNCYTTTGSFSRSAVNSDSGAKTGLAGFITAWVVGFVLLFLTPVFEKLPYNVLGAIVCSSVTGLLEYEHAIYLFKVNKLDWLVWMASFLGTLFISIEIGLGISIGLALMIVIYESAFPHTALLGRIPGSGVYRNVKQYPGAKVTPGVLVVRIDAPIYFANVQYVRARLSKYQSRYSTFSQAHGGVDVSFAILDMSPVTHIDASGIHALEAWMEDFHRADVQVIMCNPNRKVIKSLEIAGVIDAIGREMIFVSVHDAVTFATKQLADLGYVVAPTAYEVTLREEEAA